MNNTRNINYFTKNFISTEDIISPCNPGARTLKSTLNIKTYENFEGFLSRLVLIKTLLKDN